jgi:hypothetical protein
MWAALDLLEPLAKWMFKWRDGMGEEAGNKKNQPT